MAALPQSPRVETIDLAQVRGTEIEDLLREEVEVWRQRLYWDFRSSADLVERFVDMRALQGCALRIGGELAGYSYYVCEEHKGLVGDLYVRHAYATPDHERALLHATVTTLARQPGVRRIESQLLMFRDPRPVGPYFPMASQAHEFPRLFMFLDLTAIDLFPPGRASTRFLLDRWNERRSDDASQLISDSYRQHIDSHINDQYRSPGGARRFLMNIVQYPGCGTFQETASCIALDALSRQFSGLCLTSIVSPGVGHITQLCTAGDVRGQGLGYEMLRHSLQGLRRAGCQSVTLTVTAANVEAVRLYERFGFQVLKRFSAHVWEGFPGLIAIREGKDMDLVRELFREYMAGVDAPDCFTSFDTELAGLPAPYFVILIAEVDGETAGCVALKSLDAETAEMKRLYTRPAFRCHGLGEQLVREAITAASQSGYTKLRLDTLPFMSSAIALYRRLGFVEIPRYNDIPDSRALFFELSLKPHRTVD